MPGFEVFGEEEKQEILEVLDTGVLFRYEFAEKRRGVYKVAEFEKRFAEYCGVGHAQGPGEVPEGDARGLLGGREDTGKRKRSEPK